VFIWKKVTVG